MYPSPCFKFFWDVHLGVEFLDHIAILCLTFLGAAKPSSSAATPHYTPTGNVQGFQLLHFLASACYFHFKKL
jgi:hypothetical protein